MNDVTAKGKAAGKKAAAGGRKAATVGGKAAEAGQVGATGGGAKVEGQIARMLVRTIWVQEWLAANPEAKGEERQAAWTQAREAVIEKNLKPYRRALNAMARSGVTFGLPEAGTTPASADEGDGED